MNNLKKLIKDYPNFPTKGIIFKDVLSILSDPKAFNTLIKQMSNSKLIMDSEAIIAIDARGFIFGSAISLNTSKPLIFARKPGKLPGKLITKSYELEYGTNSLSIQEDSLNLFNKFVIIDDLLATGGTANCVNEIVQSKRKLITGLVVVVELSSLNARSKLNFPIESSIVY